MFSLAHRTSWSPLSDSAYDVKPSPLYLTLYLMFTSASPCCTQLIVDTHVGHWNVDLEVCVSLLRDCDANRCRARLVPLRLHVGQTLDIRPLVAATLDPYTRVQILSKRITAPSSSFAPSRAAKLQPQRYHESDETHHKQTVRVQL